MTIRRLLSVFVLAAFALAAFALSACSGDDGGNGSSPSAANENDGAGAGTQSSGGDGAGDVDACALLTTAEVEAAVGNPVQDGRPDVGNSCNWDADTAFYADVLVLVGPTKDQCVDALAADDTYTEAPEIADGAFTTYNPNVGGTAGVVTCTDEGQLSVSVYGQDAPADEQHLSTAATELAKKALERV